MVPDVCPQAISGAEANRSNNGFGAPIPDPGRLVHPFTVCVTV